MSRPRGPRPRGGAGGWAVLALCWVPAGLAGLVWVAARIAAALAGGRCEPFGVAFIAHLAAGDTSAAWPGTPTPLVAGTASALATAVTGIAVVAWRGIGRLVPEPGDPALRRNPGLEPLLPAPAARSAIRLRASLAGTRPRSLPPGDIGIALGNQRLPARRGPALFASWEDTILAFMAPRGGKTGPPRLPWRL